MAGRRQGGDSRDPHPLVDAPTDACLELVARDCFDLAALVRSLLNITIGEIPSDSRGNRGKNRASLVVRCIISFNIAILLGQ